VTAVHAAGPRGSEVASIEVEQEPGPNINGYKQPEAAAQLTTNPLSWMKSIQFGIGSGYNDRPKADKPVSLSNDTEIVQTRAAF